MTKKEKYYNFIVDDLVKKTDVSDLTNGYVSFPFDYQLLKKNKPLLLYFARQIVNSRMPIDPFVNLVENTYGCDIYESVTIWGIYKERIKTLIG